MKCWFLPNFSVQIAPDCIPEHLNFQNFQGGACPQAPLVSRLVSEGTHHSRCHANITHIPSYAPPKETTGAALAILLLSGLLNCLNGLRLQRMHSYMHSLLLTTHSTKFLSFLCNRHFVNALSMANGIVTLSLLPPPSKWHQGSFCFCQQSFLLSLEVPHMVSCKFYSRIWIIDSHTL